MPVDPGNLICLGRIGERPALVLPGCARSPKLNGIDWVLARLFAGLTVDGEAIARMGVGGLLKDVAARPLPRAKATEPARPRNRAAIAGIVLAAGQSSRMAPHNKLLVPDRAGKPMVARVVDNLLSSGARPILVVVGHRGDEVDPSARPAAPSRSSPPPTTPPASPPASNPASPPSRPKPPARSSASATCRWSPAA